MGKTASKLPKPEHLDLSTNIMRALAHPLRLRIVLLLHANRGICVQNIYSKLDIEQSVASQHLRILRDARLVYTERQGKFIHYRSNDELLVRAGAVASELAAR